MILLHLNIPIPNVFILKSQGVGKYGRCLGEIFLGEVKLNDILITEGHAIAYYGGKRW